MLSISVSHLIFGTRARCFVYIRRCSGRRNNDSFVVYVQHICISVCVCEETVPHTAHSWGLSGLVSQIIEWLSCDDSGSQVEDESLLYLQRDDVKWRKDRFALHLANNINRITLCIQQLIFWMHDVLGQRMIVFLWSPSRKSRCNGINRW